MTLDPRHTALDILDASADPKTTLDQTLDHAAPRLNELSDRDKRLCYAIVFGVLRNRAYLDHVIRSFSKTAFEKLDAKVVHLLRMALFQVMFMDRVPDYAAIDKAIELSKTIGLKKASGFVNAVLRNAARNRTAIELPHKQGSVAHMATALSFPPWLLKKWAALYGLEKTRAICESVNQIPPLTLRVNPLATSRVSLFQILEKAGHTVELTPTSPDGINLSGPGSRVELLPGFDDGFFQVQDEAAQLVSRILAPQPGETILDACAGVGGKTLHMASLMDNQGTITAMDIGKAKLETLQEEARRLHIDNTAVCCRDLLKTSIKDFDDFFDAVLLDAPCSGLGVLRRNPDTKWKRTFKDLQRMAARQRKLLNAAAGLVRPGGRVVYAVCSCEPEETIDVIKSFLKKRKDYTLDKNPDLSVELPGILNPQGVFTTYPDRLQMDGFFAARLRRSPKDGSPAS